MALPAELTTDDLGPLLSLVPAMPPATSEAERIDRIRQFEELKAAISSAQMREATGLAHDRAAAEAARGIPARARGRGVAAEIGLARRLSPHQAGRWLSAARTLQADLPETFDALTHGRTSERRALIVAREIDFLSHEHRAAVDAEVGSRVAQLGDRAVEGEARRAAYRLDPEGAAAKARNAARDRRVTIRPAPDTMSRLSVLVPVEQGVAAYATLRKHADSVIAVGAQGTNPDGTVRTRDQVMADTAVERLTGVAVADDVPVEVHLVMTDTALFAQSAEPASITGVGPVPAPLARDIALRHRDDRSRPERKAAKRWIRRLYLTPDRSRLAAMDSSRRTFTENQRLFIRNRDEDTCRTPWCDAPIRHIDHIRAAAKGGATSTSNGRGTCEACNYVTLAAGWRTVAARDGTVTTVTPTGHRYVSRQPRPPGARPSPWIRFWGPDDPVVLVELPRHHAA